MKHINKFIKGALTYSVMALLGALVISACQEEDLPGIGSIPDETPPEAGFSYSAESGDNLSIKFSNLSSSATTYSWDFGDGNTSTEKEPTNAYSAFDTYTVTLTSTDNLGATSTVTQEVEVVEGPFIPSIQELSFEDGQLADGAGDGRDSWRNSDLGGVIQITSSPVRSGEQAAKLTGSPTDARIGYQLLTVEADANYELNFFYTMNNDQTGFITVSILSGPVTSHEDALAATIGSLTVNNQEDPDTYEAGTVAFNSGTSTEIAVYFFNEGSVEARLDDISIDIGQEGAVPPSAAFSVEQSVGNFLEYAFVNSSVNAVSYEWDFGDGNSSMDESPTHAYATADMYTISLTATNDVGTTATFSSVIDVQEPVYAGFEHVVDADNYQKYSFTDTSINVVSRVWDFGDGFLSNLEAPAHTYAMDGIYTVTLEATSSTGATDETSVDITVALGFIAAINNPGFEDEAVRDDNRIAWRNETLEADADDVFGSSDYVLQTSSTANTGEYAGKLPSAENSSKPRRWLYQAVTVEANTEYTISGFIRNKDSDVGSTVTFAIYDAPFDNASNIGNADAIITQTDFNAATGHDTSDWTQASITFNSGSSTEVVLFITNDYTLNVEGGDGESETFLDDFSIE